MFLYELFSPPQKKKNWLILITPIFQLIQFPQINNARLPAGRSHQPLTLAWLLKSIKEAALIFYFFQSRSGETEVESKSKKLLESEEKHVLKVTSIKEAALVSYYFERGGLESTKLTV